MKAGMTEETDKEFVERHWDNPIGLNQRLKTLKLKRKSKELKSLRDAALKYDRDYCEICKLVRSWFDVEQPQPWYYQPREAGDLSRHEYCEYCKSERSYDYEGNFQGLVKGKDLKKTVKRRARSRELYQSEQYIQRSYFLRELERIFLLKSEIADKGEDLLNKVNEFFEDLENSLDEFEPSDVKYFMHRYKFLDTLYESEPIDRSDISIPPKLLSIIEKD